jgi:hypothetical protein
MYGFLRLLRADASFLLAGVGTSPECGILPRTRSLACLEIVQDVPESYDLRRADEKKTKGTRRNRYLCSKRKLAVGMLDARDRIGRAVRIGPDFPLLQIVRRNLTL